MSATAAELFQTLPMASAGRVGVSVVGYDGAVRSRVGFDDGIEFRAGDGRPAYRVPAGRKAVERHMPDDSSFVVITFDANHQDRMEPFLRSLFTMLSDKEEVEFDMESMYSSSLALLEEVSIVGDMLPKLTAAETEQETAEMGLRALLVAASVERAIYLRMNHDVGQAEVLVQVVAQDGGLPVTEPYAEDELLFESDGDSVMWRAVRGQGGAILESVVDPDSLGPMGCPERLAQRQVIAVPIRYGSGDKAVTLGALLIMDKRANAYSSSTELGSQETKLASSVGAMLGSVLGTRKVAELGKELEMGQDMQQQILPTGAPEVAGYELAGLCTTSTHVGGDYYDFLSLPDGRTMIVIADVSGHNLPSGMMMVSARTTLRLLATRETHCRKIFDELASSLFSDLMKTERFITAAAVTIEEESHRLRIVNAGHNPTMIYRSETDEVEEIMADDTVLGFIPTPTHNVVKAELAPGDFILLYTDGVTESVNIDGEMFGEDRLKGVLKSSARGSATNILSAVFGAVEFHADKTSNDDDITAVVIKAKAPA
ncbi:MAG: PP2C family protein-serine/threonine phosphatase [Planctomycetota bacterium]